MTPEAWVFLGVCVTALCGVVVALINHRKTASKIEGVAVDAKATRNQVSNGQSTLMRDDLVAVRDTVLCLKATLTQLGHSMGRMEDRQVSVAAQIGGLTARVDELSRDIAACPAHPVTRSA